MSTISPHALKLFDNPQNLGSLKPANGHARITGPCGDTMEVWLMVEGDIIKRASFTTTGCGPSRACGSTATELVKKRDVESALVISQEDILRELVPFPEEHHHCALLAANTMNAAAKDFLNTRAAANDSCGAGQCSSTSRGHSGHDEEFAKSLQLAQRLSKIRHKILVLSGKGGVGKSTVAANLAISLSMSGRRVGLLDIDIHGPSIPKMLGLEGAQILVENKTMLPVELGDLKVLSIGFFLPQTDDAVIWRGPMKMGVIEQFLKDADWGELDYLVIDSPPGTGDEPLSICQLIKDADGAVIVTTPQEVALADVRRSISFCRKLDLPILGVIENMSGFVCPKCGEITNIFKAGGGEDMAREMEVPFLGRIPLDPAVGEACDAGIPYIHRYADSETAKAFARAIQPMLALDDVRESMHQEKEMKTMRFAVPVADGKLAVHFGHCEKFAVVDVERDSKRVASVQMLDAPEHQPGLLPRWLGEKGVHIIIAGGMGSRAQALFAEQNIHVVIGAPSETPETLVRAYLDDTLQSGENVCDH